jgi:hypothetical protein
MTEFYSESKLWQYLSAGSGKIIVQTFILFVLQTGSKIEYLFDLSCFQLQLRLEPSDLGMCWDGKFSERRLI